MVDARSQDLKSIRILVNGRVAAREEFQTAARSKALTVGSRINSTGSSKQKEIKVVLNLDGGENHIEVLASNGYSEGRGELNVVWKQPAAAQSKLLNLYILAIGVNRYQESSIPSLHFAANDAKGIITAFQAQQGKRYGRVESFLIADGAAIAPTAENIRDNLEFLRKAGPQDVVMLFLSGHGVSDEAGEYRFLPSDAAFTPDNNLRDSRTISNNELLAIQSLQTQKLVFIDSCYSQGVAGKRVRTQDSGRLVKELQDAGTVIFTSSGANEISLEKPELGHGLFAWLVRLEHHPRFRRSCGREQGRYHGHGRDGTLYQEDRVRHERIPASLPLVPRRLCEFHRG
ncbi:caspase family protein [Breznakiellaceae bacterium SP9]